ncbi:MAG: hypothetical protein LBR49_07030 [Tannerella sp.]|jgi:hypothetical protein|nr:hypothetical protein [Tannerella sp.]
MKNWLLCFLMLLPVGLEAQRQTEYNQKGDSAMKRMDYRDAKLWYEEGVTFCDQYSINQLTSIWMADVTMRVSMRTVMNRSLNCLNELATSKDTSAMKQLITFYTEGIGTLKNDVSANYWKGQLAQIRRPVQPENPLVKEQKPRMKVLAGYHYTYDAFAGIQIGGMSESYGWYLRGQSNLSFYKASVNCLGEGENGSIPDFDNSTENKYYQFLNEGKPSVSTLAFTAGMIHEFTDGLCMSAGVGYFKRDVFYRYGVVDDNNPSRIKSEGWAKHTGASVKGLALDIDMMAVFSKQFYFTAGVSVWGFKLVYPGIGVGIMF